MSAAKSKRASLRTVRRWPIARRDLFKLAPLAAAGATAVGLGLVGPSSTAQTARRGTCRFCLMRCGLIGIRRGEELVRVEGDPRSRTRGFLCQHGYALPELVHSRERLELPLLRRGDHFIELSWDDAFAELAERLQAIQAKWGPQALAIQTGWPLVRHPLIGFLQRFAHAFGTPNVATVSSLCEAALRMGQALTVGTKYSADLAAARTLLVWGANPTVTAPPLARVITRFGDEPGRSLIVVDPVKSETAKAATLHLSIRPGTDGALALGLIHLLLKEKRSDAGLRAMCLGLDALEELAMAYPLERVASLTSLAPAQLLHAFRLLTDSRPVGVWAGLGVEHHENGVQTIRAISALEVLLGRFDGTQSAHSLLTPGPGLPGAPLPALYEMTTPQPAPPLAPAPPVGRDRFPLFEVFNREAHGLRLADAVLDDEPYPVRALLFWASNALVTTAGAARLAEAAEAAELVVTVDPFLSHTASRSDLVLPAATFAESPDVSADERQVLPRGLVAPRGRALPDWDILRGLAHALGLGQYFPWPSFDEAMAAPRVPFMTDLGVTPLAEPASADRRFGTPTGKAELHSTLLARHGHPALPEWTAPKVPLSASFPLWLVSGPRPRARINSQLGQSQSVVARMKEPELLLHPDAAAAAGVGDRDRVRVVSARGAIALRCRVTDEVHPECAVLPAGWVDANPNQLIDQDRYDPISGFPAFRSTTCRVEPLDREVATRTPYFRRRTKSSR